MIRECFHAPRSADNYDRYSPFADCMDDATALLDYHGHDERIYGLVGYIKITPSCTNTKIINAA